MNTVKKLWKMSDKILFELQDIPTMMQDSDEYEAALIAASELSVALDALEIYTATVEGEYDDAFGYPSNEYPEKAKEYEYIPTSMEDNFTDYGDKHGH